MIVHEKAENLAETLAYVPNVQQCPKMSNNVLMS